MWTGNIQLEKSVHNIIGGDVVEDINNKSHKKGNNSSGANHVGGISDDCGGVDPSADENLMRLSGGP